MAVHKILNVSSQQVGSFDTVTSEYHTHRSLELGQIFIHPKYKKEGLGSIGISYEIIKKLIKLNCKTIKVTITGYKRVFDAVIDLDKFIEIAVPFQSREKKLGDKQLILYLSDFVIIDYLQKKLEVKHE